MCVSKMSMLSCCEQTFYHFLLLKTRKIKNFELMEQNDLGRIIPVGIALGVNISLQVEWNSVF